MEHEISSCLKVRGGGGWVAYNILVSAKGPLLLGLGLKGFGPGLDNLPCYIPPDLKCYKIVQWQCHIPSEVYMTQQQGSSLPRTEC